MVREPRPACARRGTAGLIETCKMNGVEPCAWHKTALEKIAAGHPVSRIDELLPCDSTRTTGDQMLSTAPRAAFRRSAVVHNPRHPIGKSYWWEGVPPV